MAVTQQTERSECRPHVQDLEPPYLAGGRGTRCGPSEKSLAATRLERELGYDPAIAFLGKYLSKSKNMPTQNLHTAVHSNVMRNSHKVGTTRMSAAYE